MSRHQVKQNFKISTTKAALWQFPAVISPLIHHSDGDKINRTITSLFWSSLPFENTHSTLKKRKKRKKAPSHDRVDLHGPSCSTFIHALPRWLSCSDWTKLILTASRWIFMCLVSHQCYVTLLWNVTHHQSWEVTKYKYLRYLYLTWVFWWLFTFTPFVHKHICYPRLTLKKTCLLLFCLKIFKIYKFCTR